MKIKIIKCSNKKYWYNDCTKMIFHVNESKEISDNYVVCNGFYDGGIILKEDAIEVSCMTCKYKILTCHTEVGSCDEEYSGWQYKGEDKMENVKVIALKNVYFTRKLYDEQSKEPLYIHEIHIEKGKTYIAKLVADGSLFILDGSTFSFKDKRFSVISCETCKYNLLTCFDEIGSCDDSYSKWENKGEDKMENNNKIEEVCKMFGRKMGEKFKVRRAGGDETTYSPFYFDEAGLLDREDDYAEDILFSLINGTYTIEPIVEFAKPFHAAFDEDYIYITAHGDTFTAMCKNCSNDYYRYKADNMFKRDTFIPQEQIDQIVADMKGDK